MTHLWVSAAGQRVSIASGRPLRPSHTTMHTSSTPRLRISVRTCSQYGSLAAVAGPQPQDVAAALHGDGQGEADGPVGDLPVADHGR
jgi:hypothetical protein